MKTSKIIAVAALSLMAAVGAQAEEYQGVLEFNGQLSRAEVRAQAAQATHQSPHDELAYLDVQPLPDSGLSRATVRAQAAQAAREGNLYDELAYLKVQPLPDSGLSRAAVRAQAVETARGPSNPLPTVR